MWSKTTEEHREPNRARKERERETDWKKEREKEGETVRVVVNLELVLLKQPTSEHETSRPSLLRFPNSSSD